MVKSTRTPETVAAYRRLWAENTDIPYGYCWCGCGERTELAPQSQSGEGTILREPRRYRKGHFARRTEPDYVVDAQTGCWVWQRARRGRPGKPYGCLPEGDGAHRVYYERHRGPIPDGLHIDHLCVSQPPHTGTTLCVNPDHLEPVTPKENRRRAARTKLTDRIVSDIRAAIKRGVRNIDLARKYDIDPSAISRIRHDKYWM